jgi:hypothetical protein
MVYRACDKSWLCGTMELEVQPDSRDLFAAPRCALPSLAAPDNRDMPRIAMVLTSSISSSMAAGVCQSQSRAKGPRELQQAELVCLKNNCMQRRGGNA